MTKDKLLQLRISEKELEMLNKISEDRLVTKSQLVRTLILEAYDKLNK